jgi:hypothetical protein
MCDHLNLKDECQIRMPKNPIGSPKHLKSDAEIVWNTRSVQLMSACHRGVGYGWKRRPPDTERSCECIKQSRTVEKGRSFRLGAGRGTNNSLQTKKKNQFVRK